MKKKLILCILVIFASILSSCFTIIEDIKLNKNGSGNAKITVNMEQFMNSFALFLPDSLKKIMDINTLLKNDSEQFEQIQGISNVKTFQNSNYEFGISYDFSNFNVLNQTLMGKDAQNASQSPILYNYLLQKNILKRSATLLKNTNLQGISQTDLAELNNLTQFMNSPTYSVTYTLPSKVKKVKTFDGMAKVDKNKNTVTLQYNLLDFIKKNGKVMDYSIKY